MEAINKKKIAAHLWEVCGRHKNVKLELLNTVTLAYTTVYVVDMNTGFKLDANGVLEQPRTHVLCHDVECSYEEFVKGVEEYMLKDF